MERPRKVKSLIIRRTAANISNKSGVLESEKRKKTLTSEEKRTEKRKSLFVSSSVKNLWSKNLALTSTPCFSGQQNVVGELLGRDARMLEERVAAAACPRRRPPPLTVNSFHTNTSPSPTRIYQRVCTLCTGYSA